MRHGSLRAAAYAAITSLWTVTTPARAESSGVKAREGEMVHVPAGSFVRGLRATRRDEGPPHRVVLSAFDIDATLVTRAAFTRFVEETGYVTSAERRGYGVAAREGMDDWAWERVPHGSFRRPFLGEGTGDNAAFLRDDAPAVMISHSDATAFCAHYDARLPTEAEWEYAMGAESNGTRYPWGDEPERADGKLGLNFWQGVSHHKNLRLDGFVYVSPVSAFSPNARGIYDPVGNVWQWTADWYAPDTYARAGARVTNPTGPADGTRRVLRGGSWWCGACTCEGNGLSYRGKADPEAAFNNNGFRCVRPAR
ncbi:MAG TPA: SUMF1/EgtB/PvdO family nonheme iron enzyme [Polyangiaceae bacterium]|nr:SUMF1/EgtB/PvdO family nonheme iron enzyme [Polyangiaceae bacterium]